MSNDDHADDELWRLGESRVGSVLAAKWTLERLIGVGGMASVYAAVHRNGAKAAVKILHGGLVTNPEALTRFRREAQIANRVDHPSVVKIIDDDITPDGEPFLVMELLRGESVEARAARSGGRVALAEALTIAERTLAVLEVAHAAHVVHRDLKPENLFLTLEGDLKVLDFGIARLREGDGALPDKRTRTGMLMGTPAYMAPEQALGRWSEVDGRTDLWAVGAMLFTLITGRAVHEGETANEVIVNAATRPVSSIARYAQLPIEIVRIVDRALSFDASQRFPDAASMRVEVRAALEKLAPDAALGARATAPRAAGDGPAERQQQADDAFDAVFATPEDVEAMAGMFTLLERALFAMARYGQNHPEAGRQFEAALTSCVAKLQSSDAALIWNVTPYGFAAGEQMVWEPRAPFDRVPYQLFSDGVRLMGLLPGLSAQEFRDFVHVITLDRARTMAPEDDFVTVLWEASFEHVVYRAVDAFVEGDQSKLAKFESEKGAIVALAHFDTAFQLEDCWQERDKAQPADAEDRQRRLLLLLKSERVDAEAIVRAEHMRPAGASPVQPGALAIAEETLAAFAAQLGIDTRATGDRFAACAAMAWGEASDTNATASLVAPLRSAVDGLSAADPAAAVALVSATCAAFDRVYSDKARAEALRGALVGAIVSSRTMKLLLEGVVAANKGDRDVFLRCLETILRYADDAHVNTALDVITDLNDPPLLELVLVYLSRVGHGHEVRMGAAFAEADLDLGLALIRVLSRISTPEARNAIMRASTSPHPVVRIEALSHLEGVSSERVRAELKALLGDHDPGVRLAALRTIGRHQVRAAGPSLVLRIRAPEFDKLPLEERRTALETLVALAQNRAEAVCLEILTEAPIVSSDAHEQTRAIAAEILGSIATSAEVVEALGAASKSRWRNSERVRSSAARARELIEIRISQPPPGSKKP